MITLRSVNMVRHDISTPSVRADSSSKRNTNSAATKIMKQVSKRTTKNEGVGGGGGGAVGIKQGGTYSRV